MPDIERALISTIIAEADLVSTLTAGVRASWFEDTDEHRPAFKWIVEYFGRYGEPPTDDALHMQFPNYRLIKPREPYDYYLDQLREQRKRTIVMDAQIEMGDALDRREVDAAASAMARAQLRLGKEVTLLTDEDAVETPKDRLATYTDRKANIGKLSGVTTGFPSLDFVTGGFRDQQFIVLGGAPKQCKSWALMRMAVAAHDTGKKVLFISFEMTKEEQLCRYDGITCGVNASHLLFGTYDEEEWKRLREGMRLRKGLEPFIVSQDISASTTLSGLAGKIEQHRPDIVYVDGIYMMENEVGADPGSPQALTAISRGLKRLAQRAKLPVVCTTQALTSKMRNETVTIHSLGYTSAFGQDADLILGSEKDKEAALIRLRVVGGRNAPPCQIAVQTDWDTSLLEETDSKRDDDDDEDDEDDDDGSARRIAWRRATLARDRD